MRPNSVSFQQWVAQGQSLYQATLAEYHELALQIKELQRRLALKQAELNQIARILEKQPAEVDGKPAPRPALPPPAPPGAAEEIASPPETLARSLVSRVMRDVHPRR